MNDEPLVRRADGTPMSEEGHTCALVAGLFVLLLIVFVAGLALGTYHSDEITRNLNITEVTR